MAGTIEAEQVSVFGRWFAERPLWYLGLMAIGVNGLLFGIGPVPFIAVLDPFQPEKTVTEHSSPLAWIVLELVGVESTTGAWVAHLGWLVAVVVGSALLFRRWISDFAARLFLATWFASPVANAQVSWLGKPDPGTLLGIVLVGIAPAGWCFAGGVLLGFNHFEQGVFIVAGTLLLWVVAEQRERHRPIAAIAGLVIGRIGWGIYALAAGIESNTRLAWIIDAGIYPYVRIWRGDLPTLLFAALGVCWAPVLYMLAYQDREQRLGVAATFAVILPAVLLTMDTTRVFALLAFPICVVSIRWWDANVDRETVLRWMPWFLLAAVFVPRPQMWSSLTIFISSWERILVT